VAILTVGAADLPSMAFHYHSGQCVSWSLCCAKYGILRSKTQCS